MRIKVGRVAVRVMAACSLFALFPAGAVLSPGAGTIHGRSPEVGGDLYIVHPDGRIVVDNDIVRAAIKPSEFTVSPDITGLTVTDPDDDTGLSATVDMASATLVWKYNETLLTDAQLNQPFSQDFTGKDLSLEVSAPVTGSSTSGVPTTSSATLTRTYSISVPGNVTVLANTVTFTASQGFPQTGYSNARFTIYANGTSSSANSQYDWAVDQPWLTVGTTGAVNIVGTPTSATKNALVIGVHKTNGSRIIYPVSLKKWFWPTPTALKHGSDFAAACAAGGGRRVHASTDLRPNNLYSAWTRTQSTASVGYLYTEYGSSITGMSGLTMPARTLFSGLETYTGDGGLLVEGANVGAGQSTDVITKVVLDYNGAEYTMSQSESYVPRFLLSNFYGVHASLTYKGGVELFNPLADQGRLLPGLSRATSLATFYEMSIDYHLSGFYSGSDILRKVGVIFSREIASSGLCVTDL